MGFRGFDAEEIRVLAEDLKERGDSALTLHNDIAAVLSRADGLMASSGKRAVTEPSLEPLMDEIPMAYGSEPLWSPTLPSAPGSGSLLVSLESELGGMGYEIERRLTQLEACDHLRDQGYAIDPVSVFADEEPPEAADVQQALDAVSGLPPDERIGALGNREDLREVQRQIDELSGAELDMFFSEVPMDDLRRYGEQLAQDEGSAWWQLNGLPEEERTEHLNGILARLGPRHRDRLNEAFPWFDYQPAMDTTDMVLDGDEVRWEAPTDPLFAPDENGELVSGSDVSQGSINDCWYVASLNALAQANPQFIQDGIRQNPNGTVNVRIWDQDGNYRWVTVTPELPVDANGMPVSAYGNGETWPAYYEKAFAQVYGDDEGGAPDGFAGDERRDRAEQGNYAALEWDATDKAPPYLTGNDSESIGDGFDDAREAFEAGQPVIVATPAEAEDVPKDWDYTTRHVYYVQGFEDGEIILGNPWGTDHEPIRATPEEYERYFDSAQGLNLPEAYQ
jgi:hypothetical protein